MTTFNTQTTVDYPAPLIAGMPADLASDEDADTESAVNAEASAHIPFGIMVKFGTNDGDAKLLSGASDATKLLGVSMFSHLYDVPEQMAADGTGLLPGTSFGVQRSHRILVVTEEAVAPGDGVHVRHTANGTGKLQVGAFTADADANKTIDCSAFCQWRSTTSGAGIAVLEVDMTMMNLAAADT